MADSSLNSDEFSPACRSIPIAHKDSKTRSDSTTTTLAPPPFLFDWSPRFGYCLTRATVLTENQRRHRSYTHYIHAMFFCLFVCFFVLFCFGTHLGLGEEDAPLASLGVQRELDAAVLVVDGRHGAGGADARHRHARHGVGHRVHVHGVHVHAGHVHVDRRTRRAHQPAHWHRKTKTKQKPKQSRHSIIFSINSSIRGSVQ